MNAQQPKPPHTSKLRHKAWANEADNKDISKGALYKVAQGKFSISKQPTLKMKSNQEIHWFFWVEDSMLELGDINGQA